MRSAVSATVAAWASFRVACSIALVGVGAARGFSVFGLEPSLERLRCLDRRLGRQIRRQGRQAADLGGEQRDGRLHVVDTALGFGGALFGGAQFLDARHGVCRRGHGFVGGTRQRLPRRAAIGRSSPPGRARPWQRRQRRLSVLSPLLGGLIRQRLAVGGEVAFGFDAAIRLGQQGTERRQGGHFNGQRQGEAVAQRGKVLFGIREVGRGCIPRIAADDGGFAGTQEGAQRRYVVGVAACGLRHCQQVVAGLGQGRFGLRHGFRAGCLVGFQGGQTVAHRGCLGDVLPMGDEGIGEIVGVADGAVQCNRG